MKGALNQLTRCTWLSNQSPGNSLLFPAHITKNSWFLNCEGQYYSDGECYIGNWMKDNRDGWGTQYWPTKARKYEGEWNGDDPLCGRWSTMTLADFDMISKRITWPTASLKLLQRGYPEEKIEASKNTPHHLHLSFLDY